MKVVSLFSGGLDSQLAAYLMKKLGFTVVAINFISSFFGGTKAINDAAQNLGIELHTLDISDRYIPEVLMNPRYGYGKNFNPCIDCHGFMLKQAGAFMTDMGASFIVTGEVLGQRPMSQNKGSLAIVEKLSGHPGLIVRPLSGKLLPPTIPEQEGWLDRDTLLDLSGRGRTRQMELAESLGITDYPSPAGGCLLTDPGFARRLKHILTYTQTPSPELLQLLKIGRHFYLGDQALLVVGRNHGENERLTSLASNEDILIKVLDRPGPLGLIRALRSGEQEYIYPSSIIARYSDAKNLPEANMHVFRTGGETLAKLSVAPLHPDQVPASV